MSLAGLARAFVAIATAPRRAPPSTGSRAAIRSHPEWLGGTRRDVTQLIAGVPGLIAKDGAEGVYAAALPDGRAVALKIDDGGQRARPPVMVAALRALGVDEPVLDGAAEDPLMGGGQSRRLGACRLRRLGSNDVSTETLYDDEVRLPGGPRLALRRADGARPPVPARARPVVQRPALGRRRPAAGRGRAPGRGRRPARARPLRAGRRRLHDRAVRGRPGRAVRRARPGRRPRAGRRGAVLGRQRRPHPGRRARRGRRASRWSTAAGSGWASATRRSSSAGPSSRRRCRRA